MQNLDLIKKKAGLKNKIKIKMAMTRRHNWQLSPAHLEN